MGFLNKELTKVKVKCRGTMSHGSKYATVYNPQNLTSHQIDTSGSMVDLYIDGKWYEAEFETYSNPDTNRINGGYRDVWVYDETGHRRSLAKAVFGAVFHNITDLRDSQINDIINED